MLAAPLGLLTTASSTPPRQPDRFLKPETISPRTFPSTTCRSHLGEVSHAATEAVSLNSPIQEEEKLVALICFVAIIHYEHYIIWLILHYLKRYNAYKTVSYIRLYICKTSRCT